jgi:hypothetical protein
VNKGLEGLTLAGCSRERRTHVGIIIQDGSGSQSAQRGIICPSSAICRDLAVDNLTNLGTFLCHCSSRNRKVSGGYYINLMPLLASYTWARVIQLRKQDGPSMSSCG